MPEPGDPPDRPASRPYGQEERSDPYAPERRSDGRTRGDAYHEPHGRDPSGLPTSPRDAYGREPGGAAESRRQYEADQRAHRPALPGPRLATPIGQPPRRQQSHPAHMTPRHDRRRLGVLIVFALILGLTAFGVQRFVFAEDEPATDEETILPPPQSTTTTAPPQAAAPAVAESGFATPGLLTFRGSATRNYYGRGPAPTDPEVLWSYPGPSGGMCSESTVGNETKQWCGSGWTGQPSVFERDGRTWVVFGAYDRAIHFVDYDTGQDIIPPFPTGDIIKGSVTIDPDGMPLVYSGSRDNRLHVVAFDRPEPTELWSLSADAVSPTMWNDDWDGSPLIIDDYLYEGGENSQFHVVKLNRMIDAGGLVQVNPDLVFNAPGWDDELLSSLNTAANNVSIENSVAYRDGVVYFANSGGLVQGWDVSGLSSGTDPTRVFRYWTGDDVDASVVIDEEGFLYVAVENERGNARAAEVGQLIKLDPRQPDNPLVWSVKDPRGFWTTPALYKDLVIAASDGGTVYAVDRSTGAERWRFSLPPPTWQSAVIVGDTLIQGDCEGGLHGYDVSDTTVAPPRLWTVTLEGCIESTPAVWNGRIFVGARGGRFYAIGDAA
jgi:outer membrane protein assembly factor BamB